MTMQMAHMGHPLIAAAAGTGDGSSAVNAGASALAIKRRYPASIDGFYYIKPGATAAVLTYCDMTTSGGGWMLVARTHPTNAAPAAGTWGWASTAGTGAPNVFTGCHNLPIRSMYDDGFRFSQYLLGNQLANNSNAWGTFIYQASVDVIPFMTSDVQQAATSYNTLQSDTNVYGSTAYPPMQGSIGFPVTGTASNIFYMRDCCGFGGYGVVASGMSTAYCNSASPAFYAGPWCGGNTVSGNTYIPGGSSLATNTGGTSQCMIMVR